jgi:hypothetical protein
VKTKRAVGWKPNRVPWNWAKSVEGLSYAWGIKVNGTGYAYQLIADHWKTSDWKSNIYVLFLNWSKIYLVSSIVILSRQPFTYVHCYSRLRLHAHVLLSWNQGSLLTTFL